MSTLNQLIYTIRNQNSSGRGNRALTATDRQIAFWIKAARAAILSQIGQRERNKGIDLEWEQDLGCVTLKKVDQADCSRFEWGDKVKYVDIPDAIFLTFVGLVDKRTTINLPEQNFGALNDFLPYKKKEFYEAQRIANRIYVYPAMISGDGAALHNSLARNALMKLCALNIRGVWSDPTLVDICGADGVEVTCFDAATTCYPFPVDLEGMLFDYVEQHNIMPFIQLPQDVKNDEIRQTVI